MPLFRKFRIRMIIGYIAVIIILAAVSVFLFINQPSFGRLPSGERLERVRKSPNYRNGEFRNLHETPLLVSNRGRLQGMWEFLFRKIDGLRPDAPVKAIKTDLHRLGREEEVLVWFGHSSYFIQTGGKRILVDPVFHIASPVSFVNKPFKGTDIYKPEDMPDIDYLVITHDHWDHLDYQTVKKLKDRTAKVICPLGVGEHFEYWGFGKDRIVELDWNEDAVLDNGFFIYCLPTRHFSGRGLTANQSLWASFLLEAPSYKIYIGGDGGYDTHYADIGKRFPDIDLAIMENGQYNEEWRFIHMMPQYMAQAARELKAKKILTVHHSKYALARHRWDEPLRNAERMRDKDSLPVLMPEIGEVVQLQKETNATTKRNRCNLKKQQL